MTKENSNAKNSLEKVTDYVEETEGNNKNTTNVKH
jgi:hypothetical protein